jgi:hypothetical protein
MAKAIGKKPQELLRLTRRVTVRIRGEDDDLEIPLETIADVQTFLRRVPEHYRHRDPWQQLEDEVAKAEATGNTKDATTKLQLVLRMTGLLSR